MHPERGLLGAGRVRPARRADRRDARAHRARARRRAAPDRRVARDGLDLPSPSTSRPRPCSTRAGRPTSAAALVRRGVPAVAAAHRDHRGRADGRPRARARASSRASRDAASASRVDDFGTGYSSLGLLKHLPVDELKIDRSFVRDLLHDEADAAIVQSVVDLGRRLGLRTVAEGVEDEETLERLAAFGVTLAQGFHIARPLPAAELATLRHRRPRRRLPREPRSRRCGDAGHPGGVRRRPGASGRVVPARST